MKLTKRKAQRKTAYRLEAESDLRNVVSAAVAFQASVEGLDACQILNIDATQFLIARKDNVITCVVPLERDNSSTVQTHSYDNGMNTFVKYVAMVDATGHLFDPLFLYKDPQLEKKLKNHFEHYEVGSVINQHSHVAVAASRQGNAAFFQWLFGEYIIEQIKAHRKRHKLADDAPILLTMGGEVDQIKLFDAMDAPMKLLYEQNGISLLKLPASCSGILQPLDKCSLFKSTKKTLTSERMDEIVTIIANNYKQDFSRLESILTTRTMQPTGDSEFKVSKGLSLDNSINDILTIAYIVKQYSSPKDFLDAFKDCGLWPLSIDKTLSCGKSKIFHGSHVADIIRARLTDLKAHFHEYGLVKEDYMTELGIEDCHVDSARTAKPKDERVIHRQRAVLVTGDAFQKFKKAQEEEKKKKEADKKAAKEAQQKAKAAEREAKKMEREDARKAKTAQREAENKRKREEAKEAKEAQAKEKAVNKRKREEAKEVAKKKGPPDTVKTSESTESSNKSPASSSTNGSNKGTATNKNPMIIDDNNDCTYCERAFIVLR